MRGFWRCVLIDNNKSVIDKKNSMGDRYSILRPLTVDEQESLALLMCKFFSPLNYRNNCKVIGVEADKSVIRPLSFGDLMKYAKIVSGIDTYQYISHLVKMMQKFVNNSLFIYTENTHKGTPPMNQCYYAMYELTKVQKINHLWLGKALGEEFLMEKYKSLIVRFEGEHRNGHSGTGSGILINESTILTCKHNLTDLTEYKCYIGDSEIKTAKHMFHDIHDIGIVKLEKETNLQIVPFFGPPYVLDNTLTMGYPPLRGMRDAALISQKGEINAISKDWQNCECITISSAVRPGNSGGPVISNSGYIVGIVTQYANSASTVSASKEDFKDDHSIPFYNAIASNEIVKILTQLDSSIPILYEDYQ